VSRYRIAQAAQLDLEEILQYLGSFDVRAADRWVERIKEHFRVLARQPYLGQDRSDLVEGLRFFPVGSYLIFHRAVPDGVEIVRVLHVTRDYRNEHFTF
jgi:toxin ParE1/3/4